MVESPVLEQMEEQHGEMRRPEGTDADFRRLGPKRGIWRRSSSRLNGKPTFFLISTISGYSQWGCLVMVPLVFLMKRPPKGATAAAH